MASFGKMKGLGSIIGTAARTVGIVGGFLSSRRAQGKARKRERRAATAIAGAQNKLIEDQKRFAPLGFANLISQAGQQVAGAERGLREANPEFFRRRDRVVGSFSDIANELRGQNLNKFITQQFQAGEAARGRLLSPQSSVAEIAALAPTRVNLRQQAAQADLQAFNLGNQLPFGTRQSGFAAALAQQEAQRQFGLGQLGQRFGFQTGTVSAGTEAGIANILAQGALRTGAILSASEVAAQGAESFFGSQKGADITGGQGAAGLLGAGPTTRPPAGFQQFGIPDALNASRAGQPLIGDVTTTAGTSPAPQQGFLGDSAQSPAVFSQFLGGFGSGGGGSFPGGAQPSFGF